MIRRRWGGGKMKNKNFRIGYIKILNFEKY